MADQDGKIPGACRLVGDEIALGTDPDNEVVLPTEGVSPTHARIGRDGDGLWVQDASGSPVTQVNGEPVDDKRLLCIGDTLTLGEVELLVQSEERWPELPEPSNPSDDELPSIGV